VAKRPGFPKRAGSGHHELVLLWFIVIERKGVPPQLTKKKKITSLYGGDTWKDICLLKILRINVERRNADLQFRNKKYKCIYTQVGRLFSQRSIIHILSNLVLMMDPLWGLKRL